MKELEAKIKKEIEDNEQDPNIKRIGEYVLALISKLDKQTIEGMKAEDKTIKGSIAAMKKEARKVAVDGCGILTDDEGYKLVCEYFGISEKAASTKIIDLDSFL